MVKWTKKKLCRYLVSLTQCPLPLSLVRGRCSWETVGAMVGIWPSCSLVTPKGSKGLSRSSLTELLPGWKSSRMTFPLLTWASCAAWQCGHVDMLTCWLSRMAYLHFVFGRDDVRDGISELNSLQLCRFGPCRHSCKSQLRNSTEYWVLMGQITDDKTQESWRHSSPCLDLPELAL